MEESENKEQLQLILHAWAYNTRVESLLQPTTHMTMSMSNVNVMEIQDILLDCNSDNNELAGGLWS